MSEVWLKTNRRALSMGMVLPGLVFAGGVLGMVWMQMRGQHWGWAVLFIPMAVLPLWMMGELFYAMTQPRLAYESGELLVFLEPAKATRVPIGIVECFFLGQGPSELPKLRGREPETQNVIVRLAESAAEWKHRDVRPALGHWCEGYITIRGSWCEPISAGVMKKLNQRLAEVQRERAGRGRQGEGETGRKGDRERGRI